MTDDQALLRTADSVVAWVAFLLASLGTVLFLCLYLAPGWRVSYFRFIYRLPLWYTAWPILPIVTTPGLIMNIAIHTGFAPFGYTVIPQLLPNTCAAAIDLMGADGSSSWPCQRDQLLEWGRQGHWIGLLDIAWVRGFLLVSAITVGYICVWVVALKRSGVDPWRIMAPRKDFEEEILKGMSEKDRWFTLYHPALRE